VSKFTVDVLSMGSMPLPGPEVFWMSHWDDWFDSKFLMVVARNDEHTVVVNCGPPPELAALNELWKGMHPSGRVQFHRTREEEPVNALASLGVDPAEVTHVVVTPMVSYALGSLPIFTNAEFVLSRRGWIEDIWAPPWQHVPREIFLPDDIAQFRLFDARDRYRLVTDGEVIPGLHVWEAGVHHRSSLAVCFETAKGSVVATDAAFAYGNVENNHYLGAGESYAEAMTTYERLRKEADILIPLYDPEVLERHPGGHVA